MDRSVPPLPADPPARGDVAGRPEGFRLWFAVSPRVALRVLLPVAVVLAAVGLAVRLLWHGVESGPAFAIYAYMDVDREGSVPAWFSSIVLVACAASLWTVADAVRERGQRWHRHWRLLAVCFVYLCLDEFVALHEQLTEPLRDSLGLGGVLHYSWILVAVPLVLGLAVVLLPFLRALPRWTLVAFGVSGACYVAGAVGMEMVGGLLGSDEQQGTTPWHVVVTFEELFEMVGMTLFLAVVNEHRRRHLGSLRLVGPTADRAATTV